MQTNYKSTPAENQAAQQSQSTTKSIAPHKAEQPYTVVYNIDSWLAKTFPTDESSMAIICTILSTCPHWQTDSLCAISSTGTSRACYNITITLHNSDTAAHRVAALLRYVATTTVVVLKLVLASLTYGPHVTTETADHYCTAGQPHAGPPPRQHNNSTTLPSPQPEWSHRRNTAAHRVSIMHQHAGSWNG